jgi:hemolysin-activating ACP:hemolysin acyltransferase
MKIGLKIMLRVEKSVRFQPIPVLNQQQFLYAVKGSQPNNPVLWAHTLQEN